ncbi:hypothetical protein [Ensifer adhaerens]|uniref:hypothetical protein n=1 Tax=Ensifer adhaerens TaxID=106592 RepID=UPI000CF1C6EB|nr:hypothetical protein [Ensifer adhaerens]
MTGRHAGYFVSLEENLREDDAEATLNALRQIKGVLSVEPKIADASDLIATARIRREFERAFITAFQGALK